MANNSEYMCQYYQDHKLAFRRYAKDYYTKHKEACRLRCILRRIKQGHTVKASTLQQYNIDISTVDPKQVKV